MPLLSFDTPVASAKAPSPMAPRHHHPLAALSVAETERARDIVRDCYPDAHVVYRQILLLEPPKSEVRAFLALEHAGKVNGETKRPARLAQAWHDVVPLGKPSEYHESIIDLDRGERISHEVVSKAMHPPLIIDEMETLVRVCKESKIFQNRVAKFKLPEGFDIMVEPWPYGAGEEADGGKRFYQGLVFASDRRSGNPDTNFYAYPLPIIPVMDANAKEIIRIEELPTGGKKDGLQDATCGPNIIDHCKSSEYVPELLPQGVRTDLKPLTVVQPEGPSFTISDDNLIEWQKWRFRVSFNPREGAVIHDATFDGRSILYRMSMSEMTVPYADPRRPFHRKQAFDFGDGALGHTVNNLTLGCDCLGVIKYFDGVLVEADGTVRTTENVICLHEQDNGIGWKHTNAHTGRAVVTRRRELVVQFIITLANYEYAFNFKFDQAAGVAIEIRATGIVSVVNIDPGKTSNYGNVVSPGTLAQNHQHIFCARIDPAIDGHANRVVQEESLPVPIDVRTNPNGNYYEVRQTPITTGGGFDLATDRNRVFKIQNRGLKNPISGKPVAYKLVVPPTQMLLADPRSTQSKRAQFARHNLWVTKYKDNELYAAGRFPFQSRFESQGVTDAAARAEDVLDEDLVLWPVVGLTHNPRVEDWPVM